MNEFLLIIKGMGPANPSPEEMQKALEAYMNWAGSLGKQYIDGQRLEPSGAHLTGDTIATDGPFLESKEIIAGYVIISAKNLDEAVEIAKSSPLLEHCEIYVRPILSPPE